MNRRITTNTTRRMTTDIPQVTHTNTPASAPRSLWPAIMQTESQGFRTCRRTDRHQEVHDHTICSTSYSMYIHLQRISAATWFLRVASLPGRIVIDTSGHSDTFTSCTAAEDAHMPAETPCLPETGDPAWTPRHPANTLDSWVRFLVQLRESRRSPTP
jgi:hypothetical protein